MRTNIVLNDDLMREAARYSSATSKRALVEEALLLFVAIKTDQDRTANYSDRLREIESKTRHLRLRQAPSELLRADRNRI